MARSQQRQVFAMATALGEDVMLVRRVTGRESLSRPFTFEVEAASEEQDIASADILGTNVTVRMSLGEDEERYFNGFVSRFSQGGIDGDDLMRYHLELVPWLWFLTRARNCRIFQRKSVDAILEEVFEGHNFADYELRLTDSYEQRDYCVQYRETDFNFVSRLMEEEGIFYRFTHENGGHQMVIADSRSAFSPWENYEEIPFYGPMQSVAPDEHMAGWGKVASVRPGAFALNDFDFAVPSKRLRSVAANEFDHPGGDFEMYDYPGGYTEHDRGDGLARIRLEEMQWEHEVFEGRGNARGLAPGCTFKLTGHGTTPDSTEWVILSAQYELGPEVKIGEQEEEFGCSFTALDAEVPFRPRRSSRKPVVTGPQTATVVGPSGEEIYTDEHGRVVVQFHWDREGEANENSSCWIRVAQVWAGKRWGAMHIPRIGQEVIVDFLEGDPDRPIITGRVYNGMNTPPYELPAEKTKSTVKSNSSKGGGGFNEIRFEDKKGEEQIFIHAEKNVDIRIKNDRFELVQNNRHLKVEADQRDEVGASRHESVGADHREKIGKDRHLKITGKEAKEIGQSLSLKVTGNVTEQFNASHSEETTQTYSLKAMGVHIEATTGIELKCGGCSIVLTPAAIFITGGPLVNINSGSGPPVVAPPAMMVSPQDPTAPDEADSADPGEVAEARAEQIQSQSGKYGSVPVKPFKPTEEDKEEKSWIEIELLDDDDNPVPGELYRVTLPDGETVAEGTLDENGFARIEGIDPGTCNITFPNLDKDAWEKG